MAFIELKDVTKIFGKGAKDSLELIESGEEKDSILKKTGHTVGLNHVSLEIDRGEFFVIMGLSGSGKSTLIRCVNRLIETTSGEIIIDGESVTSCDKKGLLELRRKKVSMVFQRFGLLPHKTVLQNVMFGLTIQGVEYEKRAKSATKIIEMVGLQGYEKSYPKELSGGMQQRVGLARAIATDAEIILMDEAFSALDPLIRKQMQKEILKIQAKLQKTIIFITHDLDEALTLGDRIAIMKDGEVIQVGTAKDILMHPADDYVKDFVKDVNFVRIINTNAIMEYQAPMIYKQRSGKKLLEQVSQSELPYQFIVDENDTFLGLIVKRDVKTSSRFNDVLIPEDSLLKVCPNTKLDQLFDKVAYTEYPIMIMDQGKYVGYITRQTFLESLADEVKAVE